MHGAPRLVECTWPTTAQSSDMQMLRRAASLRFGASPGSGRWWCGEVSTIPTCASLHGILSGSGISDLRSCPQGLETAPRDSAWHQTGAETPFRLLHALHQIGERLVRVRKHVVKKSWECSNLNRNRNGRGEASRSPAAKPQTTDGNGDDLPPRGRSPSHVDIMPHHSSREKNGRCGRPRLTSATPMHGVVYDRRSAAPVYPPVQLHKSVTCQAMIKQSRLVSV